MYNKRKHNMKNKGFAIGFGKANLYSSFLMLPIIIVYLLFFIFVWGKDELSIVPEHNFYCIIGKAIVGIIIHELLHGLACAILCKSGIASIKYGINWKFLTPYCHYKKSIKVRHYRIGIAMPLLVLGIMPAGIALITGNGVLYLWGLFFTCAAAGDIIVLFMLRKFSGDDYVYDHPSKMGFEMDKRFR
jgi:hypothetical protein